MLALGVALAGSVGAGLRWLADMLLSRRRRTDFPWPILAVNVTGCFVFAVLAVLGGGIAGSVGTILGAGLLGGFTTYSTVSVDSAQLWRNRRYKLAALNAFGTLILCAVASFTGLLVGGTLA